MKRISELKIIITIFLYLTLNSCALYSFDPFNEFKANLEKKYEVFNDYNFWVKHIPNLNKVLLTNDQIKKLNRRINSFQFANNNISDNLTAEEIDEKIGLMFDYLFRKKRYFENGMPVDENFLNGMRIQLNTEKIKDFLKKEYFAVICKRAYIRTLPTDKLILDSRLLTYFNRNIETISHINEIVRIFNISKDKKWYFVMSRYTFGWIKADNIRKINDIRRFKKSFKTFCVILNDNVSKYNLKLGDILPVKNNTVILDKYRKIKISSLNKDDYSMGFLPFTRKNILKLVFRLNKSPYGWGGLHNRRDCSLFVMDIFRCFGINLPRNSKKQGEVLPGFFIKNVKNKENFIVENASPLTSLIYKRGHIMLYMGEYNGIPYIAHDFNMLNYHRGEVLITDFDFGRAGFADSILKLLFIDFAEK